jgi:hypothetical protein
MIAATAAAATVGAALVMVRAVPPPLAQWPWQRVTRAARRAAAVRPQAVSQGQAGNGPGRARGALKRLKRTFEQNLICMLRCSRSNVRTSLLLASTTQPRSDEHFRQDGANEEISQQIRNTEQAAWELETSCCLLCFSFDHNVGAAPCVFLNKHAANLMGISKTEAVAILSGSKAAPVRLPELDVLCMLVADLLSPQATECSEVYHRLLRRCGGFMKGILVCSTRTEVFDAVGRIKQVRRGVGRRYVTGDRTARREGGRENGRRFMCHPRSE